MSSLDLVTVSHEYELQKPTMCICCALIRLMVSDKTCQHNKLIIGACSCCFIVLTTSHRFFFVSLDQGTEWSGMCIGVFGVYWYLNVVRDVHWSIWSLLVLESGQGCALEYLESTGT